MIKKGPRPEVVVAVTAAIASFSVPTVEKIVSVSPAEPAVWKWAGVFELMMDRKIKTVI